MAVQGLGNPIKEMPPAVDTRPKSKRQAAVAKEEEDKGQASDACGVSSL